MDCDAWKHPTYESITSLFWEDNIEKKFKMDEVGTLCSLSFLEPIESMLIQDGSLRNGI